MDHLFWCLSFVFLISIISLVFRENSLDGFGGGGGGGGGSKVMVSAVDQNENFLLTFLISHDIEIFRRQGAKEEEELWRALYSSSSPSPSPSSSSAAFSLSVSSSPLSMMTARAEMKRRAVLIQVAT